MKIDDLFEARRNPDLNPKLDVVQELERYIDDNVYIHLADIPKVGVNPATTFFTPGGVYAYRLRRMWKEIENNGLPFAGHRKYVFVLEPTRKMTAFARYTASEWRSDAAKLVSKYGRKRFNLSMDTETFQDYVNVAIQKGLPEYDFANLSLNDLMHVAYYTLTNRHRMHPIGVMLGTTRLIAMDGERYEPNIWVWNKILRELGHYSLYDHGLGIIHKNEPSQALFLSPDSYRIVTMLENKRR